MSSLSEAMEAARQAWLRTQRQRVVRGLCVMCGQTTSECWCGHGNPEPYKPTETGEDDASSTS